MSWKTLVVLAAAVSAASAGLTVNSCVLHSTTVVKQFKLSSLSSAFGDLLTTELNGNIYIISICRPVPQIYYDSRQLVGSIKITTEGYTVDLGRIDQTSFVVNENTIVLTYIGGDQDRNPKDNCKGLKWSTYLTFICDPFSTKDELTLIDEDPNQPEICQIWFEIKTSKTCNREPNISLDVQAKDLINENKQNHGEKYTEIGHNSSSKSIVVASPYIIKNNKHENKEEKKDSLIPNKNKHDEKILSEDEHKDSSENTKPEDKVSNYKNGISGKENEHLNHYNSNNKQIPSNGEHNENAHYINPEDEQFKNRNDISVKDNNQFNKYNTNKNKISSNSAHVENSQSSDSKSKSSKNGNQNSEKENETSDNVETNSFKIPSDDEHKEKYKNINFKNNKSRDKNNILGKGNEPLNQYRENIRPLENEHNENSQGTNSESKLSKNENDNANSENKHLNISNTNGNKTLFSNTEYTYNSKSIDSESEQSRKENENSDKNYVLINHDSTINDKIHSESQVKENFEKTNPEKKLSRNGNESSDNKNESLNHDGTNSNKISPGSKHKENSETANSVDKASRNGNESFGKENKPFNDNDINSSKIPSSSEQKENSEIANSADKASRNGNESSGKDNKPFNNNDINRSKIPSSSEQKDNSESINAEGTIPRNENENSENKIVVISLNEKNSSRNQTNTSTKYRLSNTTSDVTLHIPSDINVITNSSTEKSIITNNTKYPSEFNGTYVNQINNANKIIKNDQSVTETSHNSVTSDKNANLSNDSSNNDNSKTIDPTSQSDDNFSFGNFFSKLFSKNMKLSSTQIIAGISSLVVGFGVIGIAVNRYYYKLSGSDQIPFKGTFQAIFNFIQIYIIQKLCCCGRDLEAADFTSEKTPLLNPKNIPTPTVEDEKSPKHKKKKINNDESQQQRNENADNGDSKGHNTKNGYGSMSNESNSDTSIKKYRKKKRKSKSSDMSSNDSSSEKQSHDVIINLMKSESDDLVGKSIKGIISEQFNTKVKPVFERIFGKASNDEEKNKNDISKKVIITEENNKDEDLKAKSTFQSIFGNVTEKIEINEDQNKENSVKRDTNVEIKSSTDNGNVQEEQDKLNITDLDLNTNNPVTGIVDKTVKPVFENGFEKASEDVKTNDEENNKNGLSIKEIITEKSNEDEDVKVKPTLQSIFEKMTGEIEIHEDQNKENSVERDTNVEINSSTNNVNVQEEQDKLNITDLDPNTNNLVIDSDVVTKENKNDASAVPKDSADITLTGIRSKNNESKLKFLGLTVEKEKDSAEVGKTATVESSVSEKKTEGDEDDVEVIEEIIYVDSEGDEGEEEIIEEVMTTTTENPQDEFDETGTRRPSVTVTTVRKTSVRKISSSSNPGVETSTTEETVEVFGDTPEREKKPFGFELGFGKSGVNVTVGEKKMDIGMSGVKFGKREESSSRDEQQPEAMTIKLDKSGLRLNHGKQREKSDKQTADGDQEKTRSASVLNSKTFKRSTSHPTSSVDIREVENVESPEVPSRKVSRSTSSLLKFGKSRSKSTSVIEANVTTDPKVIHSFLDHERDASHRQRSQIGVNGARSVDVDVPGKVIAATGNVISSLLPATDDGLPSPSDLASAAKGVEDEMVSPFKMMGSLAGSAVGTAVTGIGSVAAATGIGSAVAANDDGSRRDPVKNSDKKSSNKTKRGRQADNAFSTYDG